MRKLLQHAYTTVLQLNVLSVANLISALTPPTQNTPEMQMDE